MSNAISKRLVTREKDLDVPLGVKILSVWAGLRALPIAGFALYLVLQTVQNLSAAGIFGSLLSLVLVLALLGYAGFAGITAISLWTASPNGIRGVVGLGAVGVFVSMLFIGTEDPLWLIGFAPELYPLALVGMIEISAAAVYILMNLTSIVPILYVFRRREVFQ